MNEIDEITRALVAFRDARNWKQLSGIACLDYRPPVDSSRSADGSTRYLFPAGTGRFVESVYIPHRGVPAACGLLTAKYRGLI